MTPTPESILFNSLFFAWAQANGETFRVGNQRILIAEGQAIPDLYLLLEGLGQVRTAIEQENGTSSSMDLAEIGPGQFVGEMSLLEDRLPVATVVALSNSCWIRVSYGLLLQAMVVDKALASSTYQVFAKKLSLQLSSQNALIHRWPGRDIEPLRKVLLVFGEWNEMDVAWLAHQGSRLMIQEGSTIIRESEQLDHLFVVLDGEADVVVNQDGKLSTVGSSRRGEILGEMSFLSSDDLATATVKARESMVLLAMPKEQIREQLKNDLSFAERFYRSLAVLLSHRCRDQLMARGLAAQAAAFEELDLTTLSNMSTAGRRFEWLCQDVNQR